MKFDAKLNLPLEASTTFVERIKEKIETRGAQREQPGMRQIQAKAPPAVHSEPWRGITVWRSSD